MSESPKVRWAEFRQWDDVACQQWLRDGNAAIVPGIVARIRGGESMYLITRDRETFVLACAALETTPSDLPQPRCSINIDGENLLRAIVLCRYERGETGPLETVGQTWRLEPWRSTCAKCGLPFNHVASHITPALGGLISRTEAACVRDHRWSV